MGQAPNTNKESSISGLIQNISQETFLQSIKVEIIISVSAIEHFWWIFWCYTKIVIIIVVVAAVVVVAVVVGLNIVYFKRKRIWQGKNTT